MAPRFKTYQATNWNVYTNQAAANAFILGISTLGSSVLDGGSISSTALSNVSNIVIREGQLPSNGIFFSIIPATATVTLRIKNFVINDAYKFLVNSPLKITLDNANTNSSGNTYDSETVYFYGFIDDVEVALDPNAGFSVITISATSKRSKNLNNLFGVPRNTSSLKSALISAAYPLPEDSVYNVYPNHPKDLVIADSKYHYSSTNNESKPLAEWLQEFIQSDIYYACDTYKQREGFAQFLGSPAKYAFTQDPEHTLFISSVVSANYNNLVGGLGEDSIFDLQMGWDGSESPSGVDLTLYENSAITYQSQQAIISSTSANTWTNSPDVKDLTELTAVGQSALTNTRQFVPKRFSVQQAFNNKSLIYSGETFYGTKAGSLPSPPISATTYFYPENTYNLGDPIGLTLPSYTSTPICMIIVGRTHEIDQNNWIISYDLWKGK